MVWGICWPKHLGRYRPLGSFESIESTGDDGWRARMKRYALTEMTKSQREALTAPDYEDDHLFSGYYASMAERKFANELGSIPLHQFHPVTKIEPHEIPGDFFFERSAPNLGDLIQLAGILTVSEPLYQCIEELEPSVHKSFSTKLVNRSGTCVEGYRLVVVNNYFDAVIPDGEIVPHGDEPMWGQQAWPLEERANIRKLEFKRTVISGVHLWFDRKIDDALIFVSDELMEAIKSAGLHIPKHAQAREI